MVFTSNEFLIFFLACAGGYFLLPHAGRWFWLLTASYAFYAAGDARFLPLLAAITAVAYLAGRAVAATMDAGRRKILLTVSVLGLLTPLFTYKYLDFLIENATGALPSSPALPGLDLLLPLGISFFTFQALGYVIDVYRRDVPVERHPGYLALYIAFFPQLIAGPIERAGNLLPQFRNPVRPDPDAISSGAALILWGVFKKLVIADNLAPYVDTVYADPGAHTGLPMLIATVFFAFQIYCDFSGYVDIARGAARILGIRLMLNFDRPYGARSVGEFWHRWHISLSSWFRDYVYVPLGGSRVGTVLHWRNIAAVFLLSGLWHGANWTFVAWGALHGAALIVTLATRDVRGRAAAAIGLDRAPMLHRILQVATTFAFVCFAWIFFRAASLDDALMIAGNLFTGLTSQLANGDTLAGLIETTGASPLGFAALSGAVLLMFVWHVLPERTVRACIARPPVWLSWGGLSVTTFGVLFWAAADTDAFIYFRF